MENDTATDGGCGHSREDSAHVPRSWNGALTGIVAGVAVGMNFGVVVVGGAVLGAVVGDEIEKAALRRRARRS